MSRPGFAFRDLVVCMLLVPLVGVFCLAAIQSADDIQARVQCAGNLRMIGQALLIYSNDNRGPYPRTIYEPGDDPKPVWGTPYEGNNDLGPMENANPFAKDNSPAAATRPKPNDVTAALYLLMRTQDITSMQFVCPATLKDPWDFGRGANTALNWTNWRGNEALRKHLSYSYQNPYGSTDAVAKGYRLNNSLGAAFAIAADMNPGTDALLKVTLMTKLDEMRGANSPNHSRNGQNVLFGDGHVDWQSNPFAGVKRDNIYTYGDSGQDHPEKSGDGIVGSPVDADDSILLPTARHIGAANEQGDLLEDIAPRPLTAQEKQDLTKKLVGHYIADRRERAVRLEITHGKLIGSVGPSTITFSYEIRDMVGDRIRLRLSDPDTPDATAYILPDEQGVTIRGGTLAGRWERGM